MKRPGLHLQVFQSSGFYPIATFWVVASVIAYVIAQQWLGVLGGFLLLFLSAVLAILAATWRELLTYRDQARLLAGMLDGQRTELLAEIGSLRDILWDNGIAPPPAGPKEKQARQQQAEAHNRKG